MRQRHGAFCPKRLRGTRASFWIRCHSENRPAIDMRTSIRVGMAEHRDVVHDDRRPFLRHRSTHARHSCCFVDQLAWFRSQLPGHVLAIQTGAVWRVAGHPKMPDRPLLQPQANASPGNNTKIPRWRTAVARRLWASGTPVAWIAQTGRRPGVIAERILVSRWSGRAVRRPTRQDEMRCQGRDPQGRA